MHTAGFSVYYITGIMACIALFMVLLIHNRRNLDRQEKQIKFDYALISFILYFVVDCFWAAASDGLIPKERIYVVIIDFFIYVLMAAICYSWLNYVMAVVQVPGRNSKIMRLAVVFPFLVATILMVINYIIAPQSLITEDLETSTLYSVYLLTVPAVYLGAILFYTLKRAGEEKNTEEKRKLIFIGLLPLCTVVGGVVQQAFPTIPLYCFIDSIIIVTFYIQSIEARVSLDALTNLNNRGEFMRYASHSSNLHMDDRSTVIVMMDIDKFKAINDTYGHAEGDQALVIVADSLKKAIKTYSMPSFLGRYGGDEFVLIIHPETGTDVDRLVSDIRKSVQDEIASHKTEYDLALSVGYDELEEKNDSVQDCMKRADDRLYEDKKRK